jgi:RNA polymerase sigma-70 factor (ECF subfamily)
VSISITTQTDIQSDFSALLEQHRGILIRVSSTYCWHVDDREELIQDIITQLWRSFPKYDDAQPFSTWMYRVALNVSISWVRRHSIRQRHMVAYDEDEHAIANGTSTPDEDGRIAFLKRFIDDLDPLNRALMLLYLDEQSYRDIADILGISETNVATKISRLKQNIREQSTALTDEGATNGTQ